jgi:excisionase family DNA binding protein
MRRPKPPAESVGPALPSLRFEVSEAAQILRMSRAQIYNRIQDGSLKPQKDGARTYITRAELERYVDSCSVTLTNERNGRAPLHPPSP